MDLSMMENDALVPDGADLLRGAMREEAAYRSVQHATEIAQKDSVISQKNAQLVQKDAEVAQKDAQIRAIMQSLAIVESNYQNYIQKNTNEKTNLQDINQVAIELNERKAAEIQRLNAELARRESAIQIRDVHLGSLTMEVDFLNRYINMLGGHLATVSWQNDEREVALRNAIRERERLENIVEEKEALESEIQQLLREQNDRIARQTVGLESVVNAFRRETERTGRYVRVLEEVFGALSNLFTSNP
ncbi:unnamed protein product [Orchesella dallaii]|uniref:Uncharacterized protein n=1 Tax=Orchesella dallaii TaxID=48710 RepID=A0ABP1RSJ7_9HEXA